jgi:hypothetical protein
LVEALVIVDPGAQKDQVEVGVDPCDWHLYTRRAGERKQPGCFLERASERKQPNNSKTKQADYNTQFSSLLVKKKKNSS